MFKQIKDSLKALKRRYHYLELLPKIYADSRNDLKNPKMNLGQIQSFLNNQRTQVKELAEVEFQVFSQWGDDGIIQYLVNRINFPNKSFIEFGVEDYRESNTRFLLLNNHWAGYIIDGSPENIDYVNNDIISWAADLKAECSFITKENINKLLLQSELGREIGILSIDIDGNDYWIWQEIDSVNPVLVIAEYNSLFGSNKAWTVPYDPAFVRSQKHPSLIYYGASLKALCILAKEKGFEFIGSNSKGNNAYFLRKDKIGDFKPLTCEEGYKVSSFREGSLNGKRLSREKRIGIISGMDVYDVEKSAIVKIDPSEIIY